MHIFLFFQIRRSCDEIYNINSLVGCHKTFTCKLQEFARVFDQPVSSEPVAVVHLLHYLENSPDLVNSMLFPFYVGSAISQIYV